MCWPHAGDPKKPPWALEERRSVTQTSLHPKGCRHGTPRGRVNQCRLSFRARFVPCHFPLHLPGQRGAVPSPFPAAQGEQCEDLGAEQRRTAGGCPTQGTRGDSGLGQVSSAAGSQSPPAPRDPQAIHWLLFFSLPTCEMGAASPISLPGGARLPVLLCHVLRDPRAQGRVLPRAVGCPGHA